MTQRNATHKTHWYGAGLAVPNAASVNRRKAPRSTGGGGLAGTWWTSSPPSCSSPAAWPSQPSRPTGSASSEAVLSQLTGSGCSLAACYSAPRCAAALSGGTDPATTREWRRWALGRFVMTLLFIPSLSSTRSLRNCRQQ